MVLSEEIAVKELNIEKKKNKDLLIEINQKNQNISNICTDTNEKIIHKDNDRNMNYQQEILTLKNQLRLLLSKNDMMISDIYPNKDNPFGDFGVINPQGGQDSGDKSFRDGSNKDFSM
jgi:hypothetical protein